MNILLRDITLDDTKNIVKWRNSSFVLENFIDQTIITEESHINYFHEKIKTGCVKQFIIVCDGKDVGTTFLRDINFKNKEAEFGIFIGDESYLGKGVGREAIKLIVKFAFENLNLNRVFLRVLYDNKRAISSYLKSGFKIFDKFETIILNGKIKKVVFMEMNHE